MIKTNIVADRIKSSYAIPIQIDEKIFSIKLDTGAAHTVISLDVFADNVGDEYRDRIKDYFDHKGVKGKTFTSASGDMFLGYLVHAKNILMDDELIENFYYYLVMENKRVIALMGDDFLERCDFFHNAYGNIEITAIYDETYVAQSPSVEEDDLVHFIDDFMISGEDNDF